MATKQYCYGALPATVMAEAVDEAIYLGHRYRNRLCELELERRAEVDWIIRELADDYVQACHAVTQAEESIESIYSGIRKRGQKNREKPKPTKQERDDIKGLRQQLKDLRAVRRSAKKSAFSRPYVVAALDQSTAEHSEQRRQARADSGLYWGTYLTVEDACKDFGRGAPPKFHRFRGEGKIAVQLQKGLDAEKAVSGADNRLRLVGEGRNRELWIRIGSEGRDPIFARVPIIWHRDLPDESSIKWAYLEKRKVASDTYWQLRLVVSCPNEIREPLHRRGVVAVHVGWRKTGEALRVARWLGSDGEGGDLVIPKRYVDMRKKCDDLQSIRELHFNRARHRLCQWIDEASKRGIDLPEWLTEARTTMRLWKRIDRLVKLLLHWRVERFSGDERVFRLLHGLPDVSRKGWRKRDKHLWLWQSHARERLKRWRMDYYRNVAADLSRRYGRVCLLEAEWAQMRRKADLLEDENQTTRQRYYSALAAVATLNRVISESFGKDCVVSVDHANITQDCHLCGHRNEVNGQRLLHQCGGCSETWDIDNNGVRNQLARCEVAAESLESFADVMAQRVKENSEPKPLSKRQLAMRAARKRKAEAKEGKDLG